MAGRRGALCDASAVFEMLIGGRGVVGGGVKVVEPLEGSTKTDRKQVKYIII